MSYDQIFNFRAIISQKYILLNKMDFRIFLDFHQLFKIKIYQIFPGLKFSIIEIKMSLKNNMLE